nr:MAG TPA: MepB, DNA BINDING PROTEIN.1A [Caudoviricetes sp.]
MKSDYFSQKTRKKQGCFVTLFEKRRRHTP